ncbi:hypothetical protein BOTBODRAFT_35362 [Botryobasidium botryosum FD-172 SS1]|uniref:protein-serine/threonine phosphatase n=1 Tax=Botryobasidium botryosum (strain FD-172 SS1) TaxID=930990 RepID=A0A067MIU7_BOTB1|nr:hypothetical protein BOTBODRAFT_35362 [Botryobasidium botryosum FD-172 SS1]
MGQTLSEPVTHKITDSGGNSKYIYAVSEMQGWRITMEDAHTTVPRVSEEDTNGFFAVFDGHGGPAVARYAGTNVFTRLMGEEAYAAQQYREALKRAFIGIDEDLRKNPAFIHDTSGCTAVAALLTDDKIYVANAGDSRSVLCVAGSAEPLSFDHKPANKLENERIVAAGGYVEYGRVNGNLALSRALGDFDYKKDPKAQPEKQIVTADPEITEHIINEEDEFLVLACDGIWDCLSSQQVCNFVRRKLAERCDLGEICEEIMTACLAPNSDVGGGGGDIGCDNMTMMIVGLLGGRTKEEWYDWIGKRVENDHGFATPTKLPNPFPESRNNRFQSSILGSRAVNSFTSGNTGVTSWGGGIGSGAGQATFHKQEDDSDSDDEDDDAGGAFFGNTISLQAPTNEDDTMTLRQQLTELTNAMKEDERRNNTGGLSTGIAKIEDVTDADEEGAQGAVELAQPQAQTGSFTRTTPTSVGAPLISSPAPLRDIGTTPPQPKAADTVEDN